MIRWNKNYKLSLEIHRWHTNLHFKICNYHSTYHLRVLEFILKNNFFPIIFFSVLEKFPRFPFKAVSFQLTRALSRIQAELPHSCWAPLRKHKASFGTHSLCHNTLTDCYHSENFVVEVAILFVFQFEEAPQTSFGSQLQTFCSVISNTGGNLGVGGRGCAWKISLHF